MEQNEVTNNEQGKIWKPFMRQLFVCTGVWNCYFIMGLCLGTPTVLMPQLRAANITVSEEDESWLQAGNNYGSIPSVIILSILTSAIGRKKTFIIVSVSSLIGFSILFFSKTINQIFISQIFQTASVASFLTLSVVILTEFTSSKYRGIFLTFKSATFFWGILIANTIGTFISWKNIAIVGFLCSIYNLITVPMWPRSPYWLASKGKFDECSKSHVWLKGTDAESLKELENLLKTYETKRSRKQSLLKIVFRKASLKPILLSSLLICLYTFSGKLICTVYAIDILQKITNDNWTASIGMLILDCVTVVSMYVGSFLSKVLKRRIMLLGFSILGVIFLFTLSGYLHLIKLSIIIENKFLSMSLLAGYSIAVSCGPMIISTSIISELLPLQSKTVLMCVNAFIFKLIFSTFLKISPYILKELKIDGMFFLYGVLSVVFLFLIYVYLPETKDKTLQEIEESLSQTSKPFEENKELMPVLKGKSNVSDE